MRKLLLAIVLSTLMGCTVTRTAIVAPYGIRLKIQPGGSISLFVPIVTQQNNPKRTMVDMCVETRPASPTVEGFLQLPNHVNFCAKVRW